MPPSRHTYPEYAADVRAAFDAPAAASGLAPVEVGPMPGYRNAHVTLYFGVESGQPAPYLRLADGAIFTGEAVLRAAGLPANAGPARATSTRDAARQSLAAWAVALGPLLPALAEGRAGHLGLPSAAEQAEEQRLRRYVHDHAPVGHVARARLWEDDWRRHAEAFVRERGGG